jgi:hypothetical protein
MRLTLSSSPLLLLLPLLPLLLLLLLSMLLLLMPLLLLLLTCRELIQSAMSTTFSMIVFIRYQPIFTYIHLETYLFAKKYLLASQ